MLSRLTYRDRVRKKPLSNLYNIKKDHGNIGDREEKCIRNSNYQDKNLRRVECSRIRGSATPD